MKPTRSFSAVAVTTFLLVSGCASVAETSTTAGADSKCKIALSQPGRIKYDPARETATDRIEATGKLAAIELRQPPLRSVSGFHANMEQALRDCP